MTEKENTPSHSGNHLHVLILEDLPSDAELAQREIKKVLNNYTVEIVDTKEGFVRALENFKPDLIISDFQLPAFDGLSALKVKLELTPLTPFVVLTGSMNEDTAVDCLKSGADDYVIKEHIKRLGPAVLNALKKKKIEQEKKQALTELHTSEDYLKSILNAAPVGIGVMIGRTFKSVNQYFCDMLGYTESELIGQSARMIYASSQEFERVGAIKYKQIKKRGMGSIDTKFVHKDGHSIDVLLSSTSIDSHDISKGVTFSALDITARKLASAEITKLSTAVIQSPAAIIITDLTGNLEYVNPRFTELTGYSSAEVIGKNPRILKSGKHSKAYYKELWETISSGKKWSGELINRNKNGDLYWEATSIAPIYDAEGQKTSYIKFAEDITERKLAEKALIDSQQNFQLLADHTSDWEYLIGTDKQYIYHSPACERLTGYTSETLLNDPALLIKMVNPDHQSTLADHLVLEKIQDTPICRFEFPILHKDGSQRWLEHNCSPVFDINGKYLGRRGNNRDITKRKQAENTLIESEEKYRLIVENANDGIEITQNDKLLYTNKRFAEMLGYTVESIKNMPFSEFFTEQAIQDLYQRHKMRETNKYSRFDYDTTLYKKDGSIIDVKIKAEIIDYQGKPATFAIIRDITQRKHAEEEIARALLDAKQANAVKDHFIANISHEIRTPLNSILGFSDLLKNKFADECTETEKKIFTYITSSSNRLMHTVDAILNISQLKAGTVHLQPQKLDLSELANSAIQDLKPAAVEKKLELRFEIPRHPIMVHVDQYSIQQVLLNLIENAIKYTKEGSVAIKLEQLNKQAVLSVIDTGIGISEEHQERIFEPYTQESEGYTKAFQGVGLGLTLTKRYLDLNHVKLELISSKDVGSTFTLTFPIFEEKAHA